MGERRSGKGRHGDETDKSTAEDDHRALSGKDDSFFARIGKDGTAVQHGADHINARGADRRALQGGIRQRCVPPNYILAAARF
jgi:hypothetical protein